MIERKIVSASVVTMAVSNMVLVSLLVLKLHTTPADVQRQVVDLSTQLTMATQSVEASVRVCTDNITEVQAEMGRRGEWMQSIDEELVNRTKDRIYRSEVQQWVKQAKELNPALDLPDIDTIQKSM